MSEEKPAFRLLDIDSAGQNLIAYELNDGEVTDDELTPYWRRFDEAVGHDRKLRIYAEMHAIPRFGDALVVEKLKRLTAATSAIERMALVVERRPGARPLEGEVLQRLVTGLVRRRARPESAPRVCRPSRSPAPPPWPRAA